jgi:hypothetical protein
MKNPYWIAKREFENKLIAKKVKLPRNRMLRLGIVSSLFKKMDPKGYAKAIEAETKWKAKKDEQSRKSPS